MVWCKANHSVIQRDRSVNMVQMRAFIDMWLFVAIVACCHSTLATGSLDGTVRLWDIATRIPTRCITIAPYEDSAMMTSGPSSSSAGGSGGGGSGGGGGIGSTIEPGANNNNSNNSSSNSNNSSSNSTSGGGSKASLLGKLPSVLDDRQSLIDEMIVETSIAHAPDSTTSEAHGSKRGEAQRTWPIFGLSASPNGLLLAAIAKYEPTLSAFDAQVID